ncbi:hypothetical protein KVR01_003475 [Diaporthe batatas]|uniref:uncharacterized protein n=1 Tax=Diaporthe batatas TaxID=748121 RepID=UPI001D055AFD|nr:uncharacterized protein KVR01_003475 [Diaporthe batatas]KAG8167786.1 hypothetical protein KVR01_003475 [Diaporthe batatas]
MSAKGKSKSKGKSRPSGFEDGFADPPVTPMEYAAERQIYDPARPFPDRIEECIQRYMSRRRLTNDRRALFTKYLALGGVEIDQRQFTGTAKHAKDMREDDDYDADNFREMTANEGLSRDCDEVGRYYNPYFPQHWDVDFAGIVAGFLSDPLSVRDYKLAADTVLNFLRYIQHHDVCPEYADNLNQAQRIAELSFTEIPCTVEVSAAMPGDFNTACQVLFCCDRNAGSDLPDSTDSESVSDEMGVWDHDPSCWDASILAPQDFDAERIFKATISILEPGLIDRVLQHTYDPIRVVKTYEDAFAVKEIIPPDEEITNIYSGIKSKLGKTSTVEPVGRAVLIPSIIEDGWDNHPTVADGRRDEGKPISLYFENQILVYLKEGMKLRLTICQLNIGGGGNGGGDDGIHFVRACSDVLPSFHTFLPQSLMLKYKKPRLSDRPPPSVDDPDAEDRIFLEEAEADAKDAEKAERQADSQLDREMKEQEQAEALLKVMERVKVEE